MPPHSSPSMGVGGRAEKAVTGLGRTATARVTTARRSKVSSHRSRAKLERCAHGLLRATCAICLQMEETTDLATGRLAPDERPARHGADEDEGEEEE